MSMLLQDQLVNDVLPLQKALHQRVLLIPFDSCGRIVVLAREHTLNLLEGLLLQSMRLFKPSQQIFLMFFETTSLRVLS